MEIKKAAAFVILTLFVSMAISHGSNHSAEIDVEQQVKDLNLTDLEQGFNENTDRVPGFVGSLIGDQTIAVNLSGVETGDRYLEEDIIGIETRGEKISEIKWGSFEETTLKIWIDESDMEQLLSSQQPLQEFKKMLKSGEIRYETYTFGNKIKMAVMSFFLL